MAKQLYELDENKRSTLSVSERQLLEHYLTPVADPTERIVAWLREMSDDRDAASANPRYGDEERNITAGAARAYEVAADAIESGEHLKEADNDRPE